MIQLGAFQTLYVRRLTPFGAYLNMKDENNDGNILLPQNQVTQELQVGDEVNVFVYKDSEGRFVATCRKPKLTLGELGVLKVVDISKIGAFLDWGLEKDLLLPYKEQTGTLKKGAKYLVSVYVDNSQRLCATMKVYHLLSATSPYKKNDRVQGTVYDISDEWGYFVAVDNKYQGRIHHKELYVKLEMGDEIEARILQVRPDGKLELSMRESAYKEIEGDSHKIFERLKANHGVLPLNDSSSPALIKSELTMSKKAFKRAVGRLLKEGAIKITEQGIETSWK